MRVTGARLASRRKERAAVPPGATIQSLTRAFALLEAVARHGSGAAMADLSRAAGLHPSTAFHLLQTLVALGYLVQDAKTRRYRLGPRLLQVAATASNELYLFDTAASVLAELTGETGESSSVAVLERGEAVILDKVEGTSRVGLIERPGCARPLHCTAIGKVLLAALPESQAQAILRDVRLDALTPKTITDIARLEQEMERVRAQGYASDDEEFSEGLRCLAAPVRSFSGQVVAALGVSGPIWRISLDRISSLVGAVTAAAQRLSQRLGYQGIPDGRQGRE